VRREPQSKIKILYFIEALGLGGTEIQLCELLKHLNGEKYQPIVACIHSRGPLLQAISSLGVRIVEFGSGGRISGVWGLSLVFRLSRFLKRERISVLHAYLLPTYVLGMLAASLAGTPVKIMSERNVDYYEKKRYRRRRFKVAGHIAQQLANVIIVNAEAIKRYIIEQHGTPASKIHIVYNGVAFERFDVDNNVQAMKDELGLPLTAPVLGIVASLQPKKDHRTFFEALRIVIDKAPVVQTLVIGDGPLKNELQKRVSELGISSNVRFLGIRRDVPSLLALVDIVVLSSKREGCPNAIMEAMAARKPVVATDVGGVSELVVNGETGLVVSPQNPERLAQGILFLLHNRNKANAMGRAARKRVEQHFSASRMVDKTEELYEELLVSKGIC